MAETKTRTSRRWLVIGAFFVIAFCAMAYISHAKNRYGVGRTIQSLGIEREPYYEFFDTSPRCYQRFEEFCIVKKRKPAHFSGSIVLSRPGSSLDGYKIHLTDGKWEAGYSDSGSPDAGLQADIDRLKNSHLGKMIAESSEDWRVETDAGHFLEPMGPYTGKVSVEPRNLFGWRTVYEVRDDIVISTERNLGFYMD